VVSTPSHAVLFAADTPYRIGFPGDVGDRAFALRFGDALAPDQVDRHGCSETLAPHGLLSAAHAMLLGNSLWTRLEKKLRRIDLRLKCLGLIS
jgi:hypothetical protein